MPHKTNFNNNMIVDETKTKVCFGKPLKPKLEIYIQLIEEMGHYKYLGNLKRSVHSCNQDILTEKYLQCAGDRDRKAKFKVYRKAKATKSQPPTTRCFMCVVLIPPMLTYGNHIWGFNKLVIYNLD